MKYQGNRRGSIRAALLARSVIGGLASASPLIAFSAAAATPILPTGGSVVSGTASIATSGSTLTVDQSTSRAIINWSSFSIGQGAKVQIDNGSGATLNRVTGLTLSQINGVLSSTGAVYILNANGVIIGKTGVVNTGGTFVASTLNLTNDRFLAGGPLTFNGSSTASIVNLGKLGSLGGNVALMAQSVTNAGTITAANGTIGLASGSLITLTDDTADDGGMIKVRIGEVGDTLTNEGALAAAAVELRAQQGNIYALAGNTGGMIAATGVADKGGKIFLVDSQGQTTVTGALDAQGDSGAPGSIETSGEKLDIGSALVNAHGGTWLLDPGSLTINATAAATINAALDNETSVAESTGSRRHSGAGKRGSDSRGDIIIAAALSWSTSATLTLDSYHSILVKAPITVTGPGGVILTTNDGGAGGDLVFAKWASLHFTKESADPTLTINGNAYTLLYKLARSGSTGPDKGKDDIAGIDANTAAGGDGGYYALAANLTAPTGVTFTSSLVGLERNAVSVNFTPLAQILLGFKGSPRFTGVFEGLGHTITGLTINDSSGYDSLGLFGASSGVIRDIGLVGGSITGNGVALVGDLVGTNTGVVDNSFASGAVLMTGSVIAGGLVGANYGTVNHSHSGGAVSGGVFANVGGLVGDNFAAVNNSYATGAVTAANRSAVGGLVGGDSLGNVSTSYATGTVIGGDQADIGGLVGSNIAGGIQGSFATGTVVGGDQANIGGLVGYNQGSIQDSDATGAVTGGASGAVGGLVGVNAGPVSTSFATGAVTGGASAGGLVGSSYGTVTASYWDVQTTGQPTSAGSSASYGLRTAAFQSGGASGLGAAFGGGTGGLYPYLINFFPKGVQTLIGAAPAGSQVAIYSGGRELGGGSVSAGADGYIYLAVPAGSLAASGNTVGESLTLAPTQGVSALAYADGLALTDNQLALPGVIAGTFSASTGAALFSTLNSDLATTFGAANLTALNSALAMSPTVINATGSGGFTVDQAINIGSSFSLIASGGGVTLSDPITAGGSIVIAADGPFNNTAGADALVPGTGGAYTIYSQSATTPRRTLPRDNFDGLKGRVVRGDPYSFSSQTFTTTPPSGNTIVYAVAKPVS